MPDTLLNAIRESIKRKGAVSENGEAEIKYTPLPKEWKNR
jgi:hypothetical protein